MVNDFTNDILIFGIGNVAELAYYYLKNDTKLNVKAFVVERGFYA